MKIYAFNGSPRKTCNTAQMLGSFIEGVKSVAPDADVELVNLYDYTYQACRSCFACQRKENRDRLRCHVRDDLYEIIDGAFHADGLVFGAPIYFCDVSAQMRAFLERLMYPGDSDKVVPSACIYTMNAWEEHRLKIFDQTLSVTHNYIGSTFRQPPEVVYAYATYQYNDDPAYIENFVKFNERNKATHGERFPKYQKEAFDAGVRLVERIRAAKEADA